jgi:hypothetical protein
MYQFHFYGRGRVPQKLSHKFTSNIKPVLLRLVILSALTFFFSLKALSQLNLKPLADSVPHLRMSTVLPQNFYNKGLGFFLQKRRPAPTKN